MIAASPWRPEEIVATAVSADEREWMPAPTAGVWMRPLLSDTVRGAWVNVVRIRMQGLISRHAHPSPVHGYVISGAWRYAERPWTATAGSYVFEPPGDVHTLLGEGAGSLTVFCITGTLIELDEAGRTASYADVFTRIEQARSHFARVGLGENYVRRFIR